MTTHVLESLIDEAFERRADITPGHVPKDLSEALPEILDGLNDGRLRVAEKIDGAWVTHQWLKKAVLLYFRAHDNRVIAGGRRRTSTRCRCAFPAIPTAISGAAGSASCLRRWRERAPSSGGTS